MGVSHDTCNALNQILVGDCREILPKFPDASVDLIFADPPYNLQLQNELQRPNQTLVDGVDDDWDQFESFADYDGFTEAWLEECHRILKPTGSIWVMGTYHNIHRIGTILQDLGFWLLNDVTWVKANPMPNFRGTRFTNATETLIWATKAQGSRPTFNYAAMKALNDDQQMRSDWCIPLCRGSERVMVGGRKAHSTQKPEALLFRVIMACSRPGDLVLDPFMGTGTTAAVAKRLGRHYLGIERSPEYAKIARNRVAAVSEFVGDPKLLVTPSKRSEPRVPFGALVGAGLIAPGEKVYSKDRNRSAVVRADGHLQDGADIASIHELGAVSRYNGWAHWFVERGGKLVSIDTLRETYRRQAVRPVITLPRRAA